jgi:hypothetical protein
LELKARQGLVVNEKVLATMRWRDAEKKEGC